MILKADDQRVCNVTKPQYPETSPGSKAIEAMSHSDRGYQHGPLNLDAYAPGTTVKDPRMSSAKSDLKTGSGTNSAKDPGTSKDLSAGSG